MGRINVLGFDVANLIAAGEVVDRPSSVVKELVENSVDAGADNITVEIQRGGVSFIRVSDNGCGMTPDDLSVSILRHATSKIATAEDLTHISTLGFRGEALAAICSVSRFRIFSRTRGSSMGTMLVAEGGEVLDITETGCAEGSTVVVEDLFFNVPARRKFLKKDVTEAVAVGNLTEKLALSRPDIAVKFISDGTLKFSTPGDGSLINAIQAIFGGESAGRMIKVDRYADGITVSGFTSEPDVIKSNRNMENFFVNGRFVRSKTVMAAVEQAYRTRIPTDKFPFCVLNINISPVAVDVNVHPAKLEIKFTNEKIIFDAVYYAVLNALESEVVRPEMKFSQGIDKPDSSYTHVNTAVKPTEEPNKQTEAQKKTNAEMFENLDIKPKIHGMTDDLSDKTDEKKAIIQTVEKTDSRHGVSPTDSLSGRGTVVADRIKKSDFWIDGDEARRLLGAFVPADIREKKSEQTQIPFTEPRDEKTDGKPINTYAEKPSDAGDYIILGEAYNTYVIVQLEDRLLFVDKHAAHERIIFDELCRKMKQTERSGQLLMIPICIELLEIEYNALGEYSDKIKELGFDYTSEENGNKYTVKINQIPEILTGDEAAELFGVLVSQLSEVGVGIEAAAEEFFEVKLFQSSCKAAIKGGRVYDTAHLRWICDRLIKKPGADGSVIRTCPHGRPVAFEVKKSSIDRQFARI